MLDRRSPDGDREVIFQHLASGFIARATNTGTNRGFLPFQFFDPEGEPVIHIDGPHPEDLIDFHEPVELVGFCAELLPLFLRACREA